jgi:hypothetical protein
MTDSHSKLKVKKTRFQKSSETLPKTTDYNDNVEDYLTFTLPEYDSKRDMVNKDDLKKKSLKELMNENLKIGLSKPIDETNKGFKLLEKFGYQSGGLGKLGAGIIEPVVVADIGGKKDGLGVEAMRQQKAKLRNEKMNQRQQNQEKLAQEYRQHLSVKRLLKHKIKIIQSCERSIYELDNQNNVAPHELWSKKMTTLSENDDDSYDEDGPADQGRTFHHPQNQEYYQDELCETIYNDQEYDNDDYDDFNDFPIRTVGKKRSVENSEDNDFDNEEFVNSRLLKCLLYLRNSYCYCIHCGCRYENPEQLQQQCPGIDEDDH